MPGYAYVMQDHSGARATNTTMLLNAREHHRILRKIEERLAWAGGHPLHAYDNRLWLRGIKVFLDGGMAWYNDVCVEASTTAGEIALGSNAMRSFDRQRLTSVAREGTLRLLHQKSEHPVLASSQR